MHMAYSYRRAYYLLSSVLSEPDRAELVDGSIWADSTIIRPGYSSGGCATTSHLHEQTSSPFTAGTDIGLTWPRYDEHQHEK